MHPTIKLIKTLTIKQAKSTSGLPLNIISAYDPPLNLLIIIKEVSYGKIGLTQRKKKNHRCIVHRF